MFYRINLAGEPKYKPDFSNECKTIEDMPMVVSGGIVMFSLSEEAAPT